MSQRLKSAAESVQWQPLITSSLPVISEIEQAIKEVPPLTTENLSLDDMFRLVTISQKLETKTLPKVDKVAITNEEEFETHFPYSHKEQKGMRRLTAMDILTMGSSAHKYALRRLVNSKLHYVTVCNVLNATRVYGTDWFDTINKHGWFALADVELAKSLGKLSNLIKTNGLTTKYLPYVEFGGISGYLLLPYEYFDYLEEVKRLAAGGNKHSWLEGEFLDKWVHLCLFTRPKKWNKRMSFREWIDSDMWGTAGSSDQHKIYFKIGEKWKKIKPRKNMIRFLFTTDEIYKICMTRPGKEKAIAIIKNEPGKVRLAVAASFPEYMREAYVMYCASKFYEQWADCVSGETPLEQINRIVQTEEQLSGRWSMPYDFAEFDHQPETKELVSMWKVVAEVGSENVDDTDEYNEINSIILESWENQTLSTRPNASYDGPEQTFDVEGGLLSGKYITSVFGNGWNKVVQDFAASYVYARNKAAQFNKIKGDDSMLISDSENKLQLLNKTLIGMNIKGGAGKFSILHQQSEFLRTWFTTERAYGYANRVLVGLTQRKPWSNTPWSPANVLKSIYDDIAILSRRVSNYNFDDDWAHIKHRFSSFGKYPVEAISIPTHLGGLGLGYWDGLNRVEPSLGHKINIITKVNTATMKHHYTEGLIKDLGTLPDTDAVEKTLQGKFSTLLGADDVPIQARALREKWNDWISRQHFRIIPIPKQENINVPALTLTSTVELASLLHADVGTYGMFRKEVNLLLNYSDYFKNAGLSLSKAMQFYPVFAHLNTYVRKYRGRISDALDWFGGTMKGQFKNLQPLFQDFANHVLVSVVHRKNSGSRHNLMCKLAANIEDTFKVSSLYYRAGLW